jgi:hypothetical protein
MQPAINDSIKELETEDDDKLPSSLISTAILAHFIVQKMFTRTLATSTRVMRSVFVIA